RACLLAGLRSSVEELLSRDRREYRRGLLPWILRSLACQPLAVFETLSPTILDGVRSDWERRLELLRRQGLGELCRLSAQRPGPQVRGCVSSDSLASAMLFLVEYLGAVLDRKSVV